MKYQKFSNIRIPRNLVVFLFIFLLTTIIWLLNALNNEYSTTIRVPIQYVFPVKYTNNSDLPEFLSVNIKGFGYNILKSNFINRKNVFNFDYEQYKHLLRPDYLKNSYYLEISRIKKHIQTFYFKDLVSVENIKPDTLYFKFAPLTYKEVPIVSRVVVNTKPQYILFGEPQISPSYVKIFGNKQKLDSINYVETVDAIFDDISKSFRTEIHLKPIKNVKFEKNTVFLDFKVEEYTEMEFLSKISIDNVPDSLRLIIIPQVCLVKCKVPISMLSKIDENDIKLKVDYLKIDAMSTKIAIEHYDLPEYIIEISKNPEFVEYFLETK